jgi:hypothetical protein
MADKPPLAARIFCAVAGARLNDKTTSMVTVKNIRSFTFVSIPCELTSDPTNGDFHQKTNVAAESQQGE